MTDMTPQPGAEPTEPTMQAETPAAPAAPAVDPWALPGGPDDVLEGAGPMEEQPAPRPRRDRKEVLRWVAAASLLVVTGAGTAVAVTLPDRTDLPGLATPNDGRYTFPQLALPPLPSGGAAPKEAKGRHTADLRALLLPAPKEAVSSPSAKPSPAAATPSASASASASASPSASGSPVALPPVVGEWIPCDADALLAKDAEVAKAKLTEDACRAAAAQGWTSKDGTRTELRLLRFGSDTDARDLFDYVNVVGTKAVPESYTDTDTRYPFAGSAKIAVRTTDKQRGPSGEPVGRVGYLQVGDVLAVIEQTNPKGVPLESFRQVTALQSSLLA